MTPSSREEAPPLWHALPLDRVAAELRVDPETGLPAQEAARRLEDHGRNELGEGARRTWLHMLHEQFADVVIWVLLAAVAVSFLVGEVTDALVILAIVVLNAVLGVVQESKAEASLAALRRMASPHARVVRGGHVSQVEAVLLVPGDVVLLEAGALVPADLRLTEAASLRVEEASLTGESVPTEKREREALPEDTPVADRANMAYAGTTVVAGRGQGIVVATGTGTEIGHIARLLGEVQDEKTPLQERLEQLGRTLAVMVLGICVVVFAVGWLRGLPPLELFLTAVSLAVAAIPEGLPAIVTVVLALGTTSMVRRNAIVRRLRAVEALGSTTVICTDKTGTLTRNEMTVRRFWTPTREGAVTGTGYAPEGEFREDGRPFDPQSDPVLARLLECAALCNDAALLRQEGVWRVTGDPTEGALLVAAAKAGIGGELLEAWPRRHELPFDSDRKRMTTVHELPEGGWRILVKGATAELLPRCTRVAGREGASPLAESGRSEALAEANALAEQALRVLAFAYRETTEDPAGRGTDDLERDLVFLGVLGMIDPPREEAREAVRVAKRAGIIPVMITGDSPVTAAAIGRELGLCDSGAAVLRGTDVALMSPDELRERAPRVAVYARVSPADKLKIVSAYQEAGHVVAMTGDGVNDAPALKKSDIGVAMGVTGTDVAKGAADIVLTDDNFASIVAAVREGRRIFANIRRFVFYLLSCNISEVLTIFLAILAGLPQPLLAVQILWVNLVTDGLPALALGVEPEEPATMERPPRDPQEGVLNRRTFRDVLLYGGFITLAALAAFAHGLYWRCLVPAGHTGLEAMSVAFDGDFWRRPELAHGLIQARTLAFGTLAFAQLSHALNARSELHSLFRIGPLSNPQLIGAIVLSVLAQFVVIYLPAANRVFGTTPVSPADIAAGTVLAVSPLLFREAWKALRRRTEHPGTSVSTTL